MICLHRHIYIGSSSKHQTGEGVHREREKGNQGRIWKEGEKVEEEEEKAKGRRERGKDRREREEEEGRDSDEEREEQKRVTDKQIQTDRQKGGEKGR